jgi:hypothetical protein
MNINCRIITRLKIRFFLTYLSVCALSINLPAYGQKNINLDPKSRSAGDLKLSDIAESIEYIPLETTNKSLIGPVTNPQHYVISDNYILIYCPLSAQIYLFNRKGKFMALVGREGQGPGEYLKNTVSLLSVDEINKTVAIYTSHPQRLLYFNLAGKFIKSVPVNDVDGGLVKYFNNHILTMNMVQFNPGFTYHIYNSNFQLVTQKIKPKQIKPSTNSQTININSPIGYQFSYYFFEDQLHIREGILNDTLYIINNKSLSFDAKYIINAGKYEFTEEIFQKIGRAHV